MCVARRALFYFMIQESGTYGKKQIALNVVRGQIVQLFVRGPSAIYVKEMILLTWEMFNFNLVF